MTRAARQSHGSADASISMDSSPLLKPGRRAKAARGARQVTQQVADDSACDESQGDFLSANESGSRQASASIVGDSSVEQGASDDSESLTELEDEEEEEQDGESSTSVASGSIGGSSVSETDSSIEIISDDPEDESFDATGIEEVESSFEEAKRPARKSRASTVRGGRASIGTKTPRASTAASRRAAAAATVAATPQTVKKTPAAARTLKQPQPPRSVLKTPRTASVITKGRRGTAASVVSSSKSPLAESSPNVSLLSNASTAEHSDKGSPRKGAATRTATLGKGKKAAAAAPQQARPSADFDDSQSDVSLIAPGPKSVSPKKKRKLRTKGGVDAVAMVEQIGDLSLTEAVCRTSAGSSMV